MAGWLLPIIVIAAFTVVGFSVLAITGSWMGIPLALFFGLAAVLLGGWFMKKPLIPAGTRQTQGIAGGLLLVLLVFLGAFAQFLPSASFTPGPSGGNPPVDQSGCSASVSDEIRGAAATVVFDAYDQESNTPQTTQGETTYRYYVNGNYAGTGTDLIAGSVTTGMSGGAVVSLYGGNGTFYLDQQDICVDSLADTVALKVHKVTPAASMAITAYTDDATTALDSPSGTYSEQQEDYELDVGADEFKTIYIKFKNNAANDAFNLGAICSKSYEGTADTIDDFNLEEAGWSSVTVPAFVGNTIISLNDTTQTSNTTEGYDTCWKPAAPIMLHEWESVKYQFELATGGTAPSEDDDATPTAQVSLHLIYLDACWARGSDGEEYMDFYQHDSSEGNVCLSEVLDSPVGKTTGVVIELK